MDKLETWAKSEERMTLGLQMDFSFDKTKYVQALKMLQECCLKMDFTNHDFDKGNQIKFKMEESIDNLGICLNALEDLRRSNIL